MVVVVITQYMPFDTNFLALAQTLVYRRSSTECWNLAQERGSSEM
jgi:hypothetical protein